MPRSRKIERNQMKKPPVSLSESTQRDLPERRARVVGSSFSPIFASAIMVLTNLSALNAVSAGFIVRVLKLHQRFDEQ